MRWWQDGPFVWGEDAGASLKNAIICEAVAQMAIQTLALNPHADAPPYLLNAISAAAANTIRTHTETLHGPRSTALMTAPTAQDDFEVWFLTGSQQLYGEETLRRVAEQSRGIAAMLSEAPAIRVKLVWKPVLVDHDAIRRTVLEANADDRVVGLVAWMHTFSRQRCGSQG